MTTSPFYPHALEVPRLLLGDTRVDADDFDWSTVLPFASENRLLLRLADWFVRRGEMPPTAIDTAIRGAWQRQSQILDALATVDARCRAVGLDCVFIDLPQQFPDVGAEVTALIPATPAGNEQALFAELEPARPTRTGRFAGTTAHVIPGTDVSLVVHRGRLGRLGEHRLYPELLRERKRRVRFGSVVCDVPCAEHGLLMLALQRLYGRSAFRLRDACWMISTIRSSPIDWGTMLETARRSGLASGLGCCLSFAEQIHAQLLGGSLVPADVQARLPAGSWGQLEFKGDGWRHRTAPVTRQLYWREFCDDVAAGDLAAATRLCLLPMAAALAGMRGRKGARGAQ